MDLEDPLASKILEDFTFFMEGLISLPLNIPGSRYAKALKARERISTTVRSIIEEREKRDAKHKKGDFLDVLLSNQGLSYEGKSSILVDLLLGGYETSSILMSIVVYFLGTSPHALVKLKEEHQAVRASKKEKLLNEDDYKKMEFTQNVLNLTSIYGVVISEALRCGNVVKFLHRKALQDVHFKGYFIPSGWKVLPVLTAVNLDPSIHSNASEFNPWRWNGQSTTKNIMPFGGGPRQCPGLELAKVETAFFLHHLVLNYRWRTKVIDHPLAYPYVEFKRGLPLEIEPLEMN
ncbi:Cytochrome p450 [Thalictrum thalictroides]|uniref:Cytochrome p450 n=1 Tax=Thalictrum thalictroides TaxID=46969 RepID=A0A7J6WHZ8_THATH|nr:Cytochrome p450 [Thalictrum thalictroides]